MFSSFVGLGAAVAIGAAVGMFVYPVADLTPAVAAAVATVLVAAPVMKRIAKSVQRVLLVGAFIALAGLALVEVL